MGLTPGKAADKFNEFLNYNSLTSLYPGKNLALIEAEVVHLGKKEGFFTPVVVGRGNSDPWPFRLHSQLG